MKLDVIYEVDAPKPWGAPHPAGRRAREQRAYAGAIERYEPKRREASGVSGGAGSA